jgi:hypothetical protein
MLPVKLRKLHKKGLSLGMADRLGKDALIAIIGIITLFSLGAKKTASWETCLARPGKGYKLWKSMAALVEKEDCAG